MSEERKPIEVRAIRFLPLKTENSPPQRNNSTRHPPCLLSIYHLFFLSQLVLFFQPKYFACICERLFKRVHVHVHV